MINAENSRLKISRLGITVLGSTGSVGCSALEVLEELEAGGVEIRVAALTANRSVERLAEQVRRWRPALVVVADPTQLPVLRRHLNDLTDQVTVMAGPEGIEAAACHPEAEQVLNALVGRMGLLPTVRALESGKRLALANKESLVAGGALVTALAGRNGERLLPVDSEHSALLQAVGQHPPEEIERLILTASGGPFRTTPPEEFSRITADQALRHPVWNMGRKITIDSATLMNKGLEVIEAHWLFGIPMERIDVVVHPESIVHSLVEFVDGNILAHVSQPDMRLPIQYALTWPARWRVSPQRRLRIEEIGTLHFEPPDEQRFPSLQLCREAVAAGGTCPAVLNAANEAAVEAFLEGKLTFQGIPATIREVLEDHTVTAQPDLEEIIQAGEWGMARARALIGKTAGRP
jgi:1-deoxy-D-xylulose-5-phosphate reductoisomerase